MPTFMVFKNEREVTRIRGARGNELSAAVKKLAAEAESGGSGSGGFGESSGGESGWTGAELPRGYADVTSQVDIRGVDLLNSDSNFGDAKTLFGGTRPSGLGATESKGKGKGKESEKESGTLDWVESDTDEQLMLFVPFQSTLKVHTVHITSAAPYADDEDDAPMRPQTIKFYTNRAHNLGFEEAEDMPETQAITLKASDWDVETATAKLELRFVKFQNITSLVLFVVDGDGEGERVRIDRIRIIGESGEKRTMGKLEKIGDDP